MDLGKSPVLKFFWVCTDNFSLKKPKKSGQKPGFEKQKWAEKVGCIFWKWHFLGVFCPKMADLRQFEKKSCKKAHLPTFISYLIAIKSFNKYINIASKVDFWPQDKIHADFLPREKYIPFYEERSKKSIF